MRVGVVACGYADGYPRHAPVGHAGRRGRRAHEDRRARLDGPHHRGPHAGRRMPRVGTPVDALGRGPADRRGRERRGHRGLRADVRAGAARACGRGGLMAKTKTVFTCTECGGQSLKWQGQCPHCNAWNTLVETAAEAREGGRPSLREPRGHRGGRVARRRGGEGLPAPADADRRIRPRAGRRAGRGRRGADRRRPGHRQVHAAAAGGRAPVRAGAGPLRERRGIGAAGGAARAAPGRERREGEAAARDRAGEDPGGARRDASRASR